MTRQEFRREVAADTTTPRDRSRTLDAKRNTRQRQSERRAKIAMRESN